MADVTLYLKSDGSGTDSGTEANPFLSLDSCIDYLNTNHADMVTDTESVDVIVRGAMETITTAVSNPVIICNSTYPLRFVGDTAEVTPGIWNTAKPGWSNQITSGTTMWTMTGSGARHIEFVNLNMEWQNTYTGGTSVRMFYNSASKDAGSKLIFDGCYVLGSNHTGTNVKRFWYASSNNVIAQFKNCVFEDFTYNTSVFRISASGRSSSEGVNSFVNCTFDNIEDAFEATSSGNHQMLNCMVTNFTTISMTTPTDSGYNETDAASGLPGSNNTYNSSSNPYVSGTDKHITANNTNGIGTGDATYGSYVPTTDIDGDSRGSSTCDTGIDEYVSAGISIPIVMHHRRQMA